MERLLKIAQEECDESPDDIDEAVWRTLSRASRTRWFDDELKGELIARAIRSIIGDYRHCKNREIRKETGEYGGPAKVTAGDAVARVATSLYLYMIGGRSLGNIRGEELAAIGDAESERAKGHRFNTRLCNALRPLVREGRTVGQCVKEAKLRSIFKELR